MAQPEIRPATAQLRRLTWLCFIRWATKQVIPRGTRLAIRTAAISAAASASWEKQQPTQHRHEASSGNWLGAVPELRNLPVQR
jgi:hypothetical protein